MSADGSTPVVSQPNPPVPISGGASHQRRSASMFDRSILARAVPDSFVKLDPRQMARNPVMFVVEVGAVLTTFAVVYQIVTASPFGGGNESLINPF